MKALIKWLSLLLTISGLIGFGLLTECQAQLTEKKVSLMGYQESIVDPGGEDTFESVLTIKADTLFKFITDIALEVFVDVFDITEGPPGKLVFSDEFLSENGVLKGTFLLKNLEPGKKYMLKEKYSGDAKPEPIAGIRLPPYKFSLEHVLTHTFPGPDSPVTYKIGIYARVQNLIVTIASDSLEGGVDDDETKKLADKEGFTIPDDGLPDKIVIVLSPTRDVKKGDIVTYRSSFKATFYKDTLVSSSPALIFGNAGGAAMLADGTKATFEANGIAENALLSANVSINILADLTEPELEGAIPGSTRELSVAMQDGSAIEKFQKAAKLSIPYSGDIKDSVECPQIFKLDGDSWTKLETQTVDTDGNTVTADIFSAGTYRLVGVSVCQDWDINCDNVVDISDLVLVGMNFGSEGTDLTGDVNKDGVIDIVDLALVGKHFGETYGAVAGAPAISDSATDNHTGLSLLTVSAEVAGQSYAATELYTISVKATT